MAKIEFGSTAEYYAALAQERGVEHPCKHCAGTGTQTYGNTSTWRGGVGGQALTTGPCDKCWGSGDAHRAWPSHRQLTALSAPHDLLAAAIEHSADLSCGSSCCTHSRHRGGQMVNGPCRCYGHGSERFGMRNYVYAVSRLLDALRPAKATK